MFSLSNDQRLLGKGALYGAFGGAILLAVVGFKFGDWHTGGQARTAANQQSEKAVIVALAPICAATFAQSASTDQKTLYATKTSYYERGDIISSAVNIVGQKSMDHGLKQACDDKIQEVLKSQSAKK
jgi:hypothetical protein